jgi:flagellar export protein FliJ
MKKFKFKLEVLRRQRKIEQEIAQREHAEAQKAVRDQLAFVKKLYGQIDSARVTADSIQSQGGNFAQALQQIEDFISGQKVKIEFERKKARELMSIEEEKHEVLVAKMQAFKVLEKLKEKQQDQFRKDYNKKLVKDQDDMVTMKFQVKR